MLPPKIPKADHKAVNVMLFYQFIIWNGDAQIEDLGDVPLPDDSQAFAFANLEIQKRLLHKDAERFAGCTMGITEGKRAVGGVLFGNASS